MARVLIGTSGWHYTHWTGPFYPSDVQAGDRLAFYASAFRAAEVNNTFYSLPRASTLRHWCAQTPDGFVFACKASRYITHMKKLKDAAETVPRFLESIAPLGDKLGPVLFQLPPRWRCNVDRLAALLAVVPPGQRCAVEFRDESWFTEAVDTVLADHGAAFTVYDLDGHTAPVKVTADFAYVRLHGPGAPYQGSYDAAALATWAARIAEWRDGGRDVYVFFDNDEAGYAALNAAHLRTLVDGDGVPA
ncbi:DUF72 domain-containing protein [Roseospira goensis]|uniref:Uncharacterized protein YecE (DUF72 family) n=1 Tax=Roseospira goensis TaxID=391922 RepID=A0A7W6WLB3_9PROT|nr:DUF72 domain-containing protein [Roseospira goensis]MBB4286528.1 uncharacterized protein YecE (DUF72 family) [Roseospira goensis]